MRPEQRILELEAELAHANSKLAAVAAAVAPLVEHAETGKAYHEYSLYLASTGDRLRGALARICRLVRGPIEARDLPNEFLLRIPGEVEDLVGRHRELLQAHQASGGFSGEHAYRAALLIGRLPGYCRASSWICRDCNRLNDWENLRCSVKGTVCEGRQFESWESKLDVECRTRDA